MREETVCKYLAEADANMRFVPFYKQSADSDTDDEPHGGNDVTRGSSPKPEEQIIFAEMSGAGGAEKRFVRAA